MIAFAPGLLHADWKDDAARTRTQANLGRLTMLALVLGLVVIWAIASSSTACAAT